MLERISVLKTDTSLTSIIMLLKMDSTHITQLEIFTGQKTLRQNGYRKKMLKHSLK